MQELLGRAIAGVYLFGSAVSGGLHNNSDVDVLAVVNHRLSMITRRKLTERLLLISGRIGNVNSVRPLEVTIVNHDDVVPWTYPPRKEYIYGEWLRCEIEHGRIPEPSFDPDLAIILSQVIHNSILLAGNAASKMLDPVPMSDVRRGMHACLPGLIESTKGDERNVILTLARMWVTAATGEFLPKDEAAQWAVPRLPKSLAGLLEFAGRAYRDECVDNWDSLGSEVAAFAMHIRKEIEFCLDKKPCCTAWRLSAGMN